MGAVFRFAVISLILSNPTIAALAILPIVLWAFVFFVRSSHRPLATQLRNSFNAKTKQQLATASRNWSLFFLLAYALVLVCTLVWAWRQGLSISQVWSPTGSLPTDVLQALYLGLAVAGSLPFLNLLLHEAKRFPIAIFAGARPSRLLRITTILMLVLAEEAWRTITLRSLLRDGYSGSTALVVTTSIYALAYLVFGRRSAVGKAITGAVFGGIYLWKFSFVVVSLTHLVFEIEWLWIISSAAPSATPGNLGKARGSKCPVCQVQVSRSNFRRGTFPCPSCGGKLSIADSRVSAIRWGLVLANIPLLLGTFVLFPNLQSDTGLWIVILLMFGVEWSLLILLQSAFPPKLQWGEPNFIGLGLTGQTRKPGAKTSSASENASSEKPTVT